MYPQTDHAKVEDLRGNPLLVGTLEEIIDDNHAIVSTQNGPESYVPIMSFVNRELLETGCSVLLHNKVHFLLLLRLLVVMAVEYEMRNFVCLVHALCHQVMAVVGILADDTDPLVSVMKVEKAPTESYADIGGLHDQVRRRSSMECARYSSLVMYMYSSDSGDQRGC